MGSDDGLAGTPFVSIVVPTRNRLDSLAPCLESLLAQEYPAHRFEVIVVHNESTEQARAQIRELATLPEPPRVCGCLLGRRDANAARNLGVKAARGDLIGLVDDDVLAPPGWLAALGGGAARHPEAECLGGAIRPLFEVPPPRTCRIHAPAGTTFDRGADELKVGAVWGGNMLVRRQSFERVGLFREGLALEQEWEWQQRLVASGGSIVYLPAAWLWHRVFRSDLRFAGALLEQFRRGAACGRMSSTAPAPALAREMAGHLIHGLRCRCNRGLTEAARGAGLLWARGVHPRSLPWG